MCFDEGTEGVGEVGADTEPVGMVQEVEGLDAELEAGAFVKHRDGLHDAEIERRSGGNPLAVARCADGTGRDREGTGAVDIGGEKRIEGTATAPLKTGARVMRVGNS